MTSTQVAEFMQHHRSVGIAHFFVYICDDGFGRSQDSLQASDTTVLHTPFCSTVNMTMRAQNWMINECIQRAAAAHYEWVLSSDIDERLGLRDGLSLSALLDDHRADDVLSLGSVLRWRHPNGSVAGTRLHCETGGFRDRYMCLGYEGHRKHLTRASRLFVANLHFVQSSKRWKQCRNGTTAVTCTIFDLNATDAWLYHESATSRYSKTAWMGRLSRYRNWSRSERDLLIDRVESAKV